MDKVKVRHIQRNQQTTQQLTATKQKQRPPLRMIALILIVILVIAGLLYFTMFFGKPDSTKYQAVFLENGQVYFGRLNNTNGSYLTIDNAFYTRAEASEGDEGEETAGGDVSLIRVGDEVYGPENTVYVRAEKVLFWQNLRDDSKVVQAINSRSQ